LVSIRLMALDVDGTLAARGHEVTPATRGALGRARDAGLAIVIATGRRYRSTTRVIEALGFPVPAVCLGGSLVKDAGGETLTAHVFEPEAFQRIAGFLRERGHVVVGQLDGPLTGGSDFVIDGSVFWGRWASLYHERNAGFSQWRAHLTDEPRDDVLVIGTFGERDELFSLAQEIGLALPDRLFVNVVPAFAEGGWYCEIVPAEISKWTGLTQLARKLGIPPDAICAVGDQRNDLPMIREAALGVAMGNAAQEVKEAADLVTGRHDEDGLVALVERILS
jgi:Cof subfamily protein (haloacid dehalogenase superfamily)